MMKTRAEIEQAIAAAVKGARSSGTNAYLNEERLSLILEVTLDVRELLLVKNGAPL